MITKEIQTTDHGKTGLFKARIGHFTFGFRFNLYKHGIAFRFLYGHIADCIGVLNKFENTKQQALFIDFDKCGISEIMEYISHLDYDYNIGESYIFESSTNHYFMICPSLFDIHEIRNILINCDIADSKFTTIYLLNGDNTIRITPKFNEKKNREIKLFATFQPEFSKRVRHMGLSLLLNRHFNIVVPAGLYDGSTENDLITKEYETLQW